MILVIESSAQPKGIYRIAEALLCCRGRSRLQANDTDASEFKLLIYIQTINLLV